MGRIKKYSKRTHSRQKKLKIKKNSAEQDVEEVKEESQQYKALSVGKKKQIFKKNKSKDVKMKILELKQQNRRLKKKDLDQKKQKGTIAKEIKRLKSLLKSSGQTKNSDSDQDEDDDDEMAVQD